MREPEPPQDIISQQISMNIRLILTIMILSVMAGCRSAGPRDAQPGTVSGETSSVAAPAPKATAYRTNGNYSRNVMIRLAPDGSIAYYPAPGDITPASLPLAIADGWMLDRQGAASENTAFLRYTYAQYAALPEAPALQQLKEAIIPGAKVIATMRLPWSVQEAAGDMTALKQYVKSHAEQSGAETITIKR